VTQLAAEPYMDPDVIGTDQPPPPMLLTRLSRPFVALRNVQNLGTWTGVVVAAVGLVLIAVAWGRVAGLTQVGLQTPYVVSAGFTGLGLIVVGLAIVSISVKREDAAERSRQLRELREVLADIRAELER
jgi:hypothetical protein